MRSHLKRGLDQLRARFDREHGGERRAWSAMLAAWPGEEPELALAASPGLLVAAGIALTLLLAGGGTWLAWSASKGSESARTELVVAAAPQAPACPEEGLPRAEPAARAPVEPTRTPSSSSGPAAPAAIGPLIIGSVRTPDGMPIAGAALTIYPNNAWPRPEAISRGVTGPDGRFALACNGRPWDGRLLVRAPDGTSRFGAWVDGEYSLEDLAAGTWTLVLQDDEWNEVLAHPLTVEAGRSYEHDFVWGTEIPLATIGGRVVSAAGRLPDGILVSARPVDDPRGEGDLTRVEHDGRFALRVAPEKEYAVWACGPASCTEELLVVPGVEGLELVLPELGPLRLYLIDSSTREAVQPRSRFLVNALEWKRPLDERFRRENVEIDLRGCLELELPVGEYELRLDLAEEGYLPVPVQRVTVTNANAAPARVLELVRGLEAWVRLDGPPESEPGLRGDHLVFLVERSQLASIAGPFAAQGPPSNHRINGINMRVDDPLLMNQGLWDEGFFRDGALLRGLAPGHYSVKCYPDEFVFEPAAFELAGPERAELRIRWRPKRGAGGCLPEVPALRCRPDDP